MLNFFNKEIKVKPPVRLSLSIVQILYVLTFTQGYRLVEEDYAFFLIQSLICILNFSIYFKFHDFRQFTNWKIIRDVKSKEETADQALIFNHFCIDWLNHNCQQWRMFETEILILNFSLCKRKHLFVMIKSLTIALHLG